MPNYGIFVDYENMSIENRKKIVPTYYADEDAIISNDGEKKRTASERDKDLILQQSLKFPAILETIIFKHLDCMARWRHAVADWNDVDKSIGLGNKITVRLNAMGYRLHSPKNLPSTVAERTDARKEAADRELVIETISTVRRRMDDGLRAAVICTGDHYAARLATSLREDFGIKVFIASFEASTSAALKRLQDLGDPNLELIHIDQHPIYDEYRQRVHHKMGIKTVLSSIEESMVHTMISNRTATTMQFLSKTEFDRWINNWVIYLEQKYKRADCEKDPDFWLNYFLSENLVTHETRKTRSYGYRKTIDLNFNNEIVKNAISSIERNGVDWFRHHHTTVYPGYRSP